jgi:hypothetical protein
MLLIFRIRVWWSGIILLRLTGTLFNWGRKSIDWAELGTFDKMLENENQGAQNEQKTFHTLEETLETTFLISSFTTVTLFLPLKFIWKRFRSKILKFF